MFSKEKPTQIQEILREGPPVGKQVAGPLCVVMGHHAPAFPPAPGSRAELPGQGGRQAGLSPQRTELPPAPPDLTPQQEPNREQRRAAGFSGAFTKHPPKCQHKWRARGGGQGLLRP